MLPATARVPDVMRLIEDESYFVVHAQRQCGKTTAFRALVDDINARGERIAMYCSLEVVQEFPDPADGIPMIYEKIIGEALYSPFLKGCPYLEKGSDAFSAKFLETKGITEVLSQVSVYAGKPLADMDIGVVFRGAKYAIECKKAAYYAKSHEKAYDQVCGYMDRLGVSEGWLVVFDPDLSRPWDGKIFAEDVAWNGKTVHVLGC